MSLFCPVAANCLDLGKPEVLSALLSGLVGALGTIISVGIAAYLTYRYTRRHSAIQHNTGIQVEQLRREIDALEKVWALLAYMTERESGTAILRWRQPRGGDKTWYVQFENLKAFLLTRLSETFYTGHAGLHLPQAVGNQLFEYHAILMGLYLRYADTDWNGAEPLIVLENPELIDKLRSAYHTLNATLRDELAERYRLLSVDEN